MTVWRPAPQIKVKALGLQWRDGRLLAAEVLQDDGSLKGVRPLGGTVEFGETWQEALQREFREELDIDVTVSGPHFMMENIYQHEGHRGHEVIFIAPVTFPDQAYADADVIRFTEDNGIKCTARWFDLEQLKETGIALFPVGLERYL